MKKISLRLAILIASIYASMFWGIMTYINKVYPIIHPISNAEKINTFRLWQCWTPLVMGTIAIILFGYLVYKTDWNNGLN